MSSRYVLDDCSQIADSPASVGGKALSLVALRHAGFPVPDFGVVMAEALEEHLRLWRPGTSLLGALDEARGILASRYELPIAVRDQVLGLYRRLGDASPPVVAVRSSAVGEDDARSSFAGLFATCLHVSGEDELLRAIQVCWASLFNPVAVTYRARQAALSAQPQRMAVVIQQQLSPEKAGVLFTQNPMPGRESTMYMEATLGSGDSVVGGFVTPESVTVAKRDLSVVSIQSARIPQDTRTASVLTREEIASISELGVSIDEHFGAPQDIEWAIEAGCIWILQSRPIVPWGSLRM